MTRPVPRAVVNPRPRPDRVLAPPDERVQQFHRGLPGYRPTPLHCLDATAAALGVGSVYVKDESDRLGLPAFKILGASWAAAQALRRWPKTTTLLTASAGNHGRAVARAAGQRGLACRVYLPAETSESRAEAIRGEGAEVVRVDGDYGCAVAAAERAAAEGGTLIADMTDDAAAPSPAWVVEGYSTLFREAAEQAPRCFDLVLVGVGVGSLAAAAVRFAVHEQPGSRVVGVEPEAAACLAASLAAGRPVTVATPGTSMAGLNCATPSAAAWPTNRDGLAGTVTVGDPEAHAAMVSLAGFGLVIGDCGAATLAGLQRLVADDRCAALRAAVGLDRTTRVLCIAGEGPTDPAAYNQAIGRSSYRG